MKLLVQPGDGVKPLVDAIDSAKERVEIAIFRFDRSEIEKALVRAVERGVFVHALIAYTNRGGEKNLRQLEMRLLEKGVTVARTADDLVRYHGKYFIIDRKELLLLAFNFTYIDMEHSRSFAIITKKEELVEEATRLFQADAKRQKFDTESHEFIVSPINARKELTRFIEGAKKQLLIYDPKLGDPTVLRLLEEQSKSGVDVRVIGEKTRSSKVDVRDLAQMRLHTRSIVRDGAGVFLGSQSLRATELETRREVGIIIDDQKIAATIAKTFEEDWRIAGEAVTEALDKPAPAARAARKVAKSVARDLPPVSPVLEVIVRDVIKDGTLEIDAEQLEQVVKEAVKSAVEETVREVVEEAVEDRAR